MKKTILIILLCVPIYASSQIFSKKWVDWQLGRDSASLAKKEEIKQKKLSKNKDKDFLSKFNESKDENNPNDQIYFAGKYLRKSAKYQSGAYIAAIGGGCLAVIASGISEDKKSSRNATFAAAGVFGLISLICEINAITYTNKAGKSLQFSGTGIKVEF